MHVRDAAALAAYQATLRKHAELERHFNQSLAQVRAAECCGRALRAEAHSEQEETRYFQGAATAQEAEEHSPSP